MRIKLIITCVAALALPLGASARPPAAVSVGLDGGVATATWSLPDGVALSWAVEVANAPETEGEYGDFVADNVVDAASFYSRDTTWTGTATLKPGTYYVHVADEDTTCFEITACPAYEWSHVVVLRVPGPGRAAPTTPARTTPATTTPAPTTPATTTPAPTTPARTTPAPTTPAPTTPAPTVPTPAPAGGGDSSGPPAAVPRTGPRAVKKQAVAKKPAAAKKPVKPKLPTRKPPVRPKKR